MPGSVSVRSFPLVPESLLDLWNLWWFRYALLELGQSPFDGSYTLHPFGADLRLHTLAPLHGLVALVLQTVLSLTTAQNVLLFFDLIAADVLAFALGLRLGLSRGGALVAGAIYAFSPTVLAHLYAGHYELMATFWLPAMLLAWLRLADAPSPRPRDGIALGVLLALAPYSSQYSLVYGVELLALAALVELRRALRPAMLRALAVSAGIAAIGLAPLLWTFLGASAPGQSAGIGGISDFDRHAGDLVGFFVPSFTHPLLGELLYPLHQRLNPRTFLPSETTTYVGLGVLGLAVVAVLSRLRAGGSVRLPLAIALVFSVLSLGSHLRVFGVLTRVPLPALLLEQVPVPTLSTRVAPVHQRLAEIPGDFRRRNGRRWPTLPSSARCCGATGRMSRRCAETAPRARPFSHAGRSMRW